MSNTFAQLSDYVGFSAEHSGILSAIGPLLREDFEEVVEAFYGAVRADEEAWQVIEDDAQLNRLKASLRNWLEGLFCGVYDQAYYEKRARIGRVHVRIGLPQRFMFGAMSVVRKALAEAVERRVPEEKRLEAHKALDGILDIELGVMLETYRESYVLRKTAENATLAAMGRLTAGLAHEIRNPLNAAGLQLELIRRGAAKVDDDDQRKGLEKRTRIVRNELARLSDLLDDFLSLARPRDIKAESVDVGRLLHEVLALQSPVAERSGVRISLDADGQTLPKVFADRARVTQVLVNLIRNAIDATAGKEDAWVRLFAESTSHGFVKLFVSDNGAGVSQEVIDRAFTPFVTTKEAGTGLGLTIVQQIVERHGGTVGIDSAEGGGTVVHFTLPEA